MRADLRATGILLLAAALLLLGCGSPSGGDASSATEPDAPRSPAGTGPSETDGGTSGSPGPAGPAAVPHRDLAPPRTGPLLLPRCVDGVPQFRFDGTVTAIAGGRVTFEVHESFRGDVPDTVVVVLGPPVTSGSSEASPSYSVGTRLLVAGARGEAWGCGDTVYHDEATAAAWREG